jgi:hypothetical protein
MCTPDYNVAFVPALRTIVVQTAESLDLMRGEWRAGPGFPQAFPQFL